MKGKGSYANLSTQVISTSKTPTLNNEKKISLLSAQNYEDGDWPVGYKPNGLMRAQYFLNYSRDNQLHYIYSWVSMGYKGRCVIDACYFHLCKNAAAEWMSKDDWDGVGSALDVNTFGIVKTVNIYAPNECEIGEGWFSPTDYLDYYFVLEVIVKTPTENFEKLSLALGPQVPLSYYVNYMGGAPSLTYDQNSNSITVGTSMPGRRILEFRDKSFVSPTGIRDEETLMNFYLGSLINLEGYGDYNAYYYASENARIFKWLPGTYSVGFIDTVGDSLSSIVSNAVDNAIAQVNSIMSEFGVHFVRNNYGGDIVITYGTMQSLWGETSNDSFLHGGQWSVWWDDNYNVVYAEIGIAREAHYYTTFSQVCFEELYESIGCGYDQWEYPYNTTTLEMGGPWNPDYMTNKDANMLRLLYSDAVNAGDDVTAVALAHNIPKGVKLLSTSRSNSELTASLNFLKSNHTYEIRVWIIDADGSMSETSSWITVAIPNIRRPWDWQISNGIATAKQTRDAYNAVIGKGTVSSFSYLVWNDLVDKVKDVLDTKGYPWSNNFASYSATRMTASDKTLTAERFNSLRFNIGSYASTGIQTVDKGDTVYGWYFTKLTDCLNSLI